MLDKCKKEDSIRIRLPLPISINCAYSWYYKRHKSEKYQEWITEAELSLMTQKSFTIRGDKWLLAEYDFNFPLFTKKWKKRIIDVWNYEKVLSDFLVKQIPWFEDHKIKTLILRKHDNNDKFVDITIREL